MSRALGRLAARLDRAETVLTVHDITFHTEAGRTFTLPSQDVLAAMSQALKWLYGDGDQPTGPVIERLATADPGEGADLITQTAIGAARRVVAGVRE
ncbi:hypothetical protein [Streptomyces coelicoflavus]|uniref:hypothetical protein n=1 Tax=Streptomyces coelicoflavus TaxID=285562 RepID=UPI003629D534